MVNFEVFSEFSMMHCVALCAFLVPANLLVSLQIILFAAFERPRSQQWILATVSGFYASVLVLHDFTWLMHGVVKAPTFVLIFVAALCLGVNFWAIARPEHFVYIRKRFQQVALGVGASCSKCYSPRGMAPLVRLQRMPQLSGLFTLRS